MDRFAFRTILKHRGILSRLSRCRYSQQRVSLSDKVVASRHQDCFVPSVLSVTQRFLQQSALWPDKTAIECAVTKRSYTYNQVAEHLRHFGGSLVKMGFTRGQVLGLVLPNIPEYSIAFFGAAGIGMAVTTVNPTYTPGEIARQLRNAEASAVVTIPALVGVFREVRKMYPALECVVVVGEAEDDCVAMKDMFQGNKDLFPESIDVDLENDTLVLPYSSGTTGPPKGVVLTNSTVSAGVQQLLHAGTTNLRRASESYQDVYICVLPFFHIYGLQVLMITGLEHGAKLVTIPRFDPDLFITSIKNYEPTQLYLVPPLVNLMAVHPGLDQNGLRRLHTVSSGAAPLGAALAGKFTTKVRGKNITLQEGYGMTETSGPTHLCPLTNSKLGSIGELISRTRAKIVDPVTGEALGPGKQGELCIQGPQVMKGYKNDPAATKDALEPSGWLRTGDLAYYDEDKQFFITGRLKELIKVKGLQVSPSELEDVLCRHRGVADAAVVGVSDDCYGEVPVAFIVKQNSTEGKNLHENDIIRFLDGQVAPHKKLRGGVVFVGDIPKTPTGKILRTRLKLMAQQKLK